MRESERTDAVAAAYLGQNQVLERCIEVALMRLDGMIEHCVAALEQLPPESTANCILHERNNLQTIRTILKGRCN